MVIWRESMVICILNDVFLEWHIVSKLLMDHSTVLHSVVMKELLDRWKVHCFCRVAQKLNGNKIVERHLQMS